MYGSIYVWGCMCKSLGGLRLMLVFLKFHLTHWGRGSHHPELAHMASLSVDLVLEYLISAFQGLEYRWVAAPTRHLYRFWGSKLSLLIFTFAPLNPQSHILSSPLSSHWIPAMWMSAGASQPGREGAGADVGLWSQLQAETGELYFKTQKELGTWLSGKALVQQEQVPVRHMPPQTK